MANQNQEILRKARHARIRKRVTGTTARPRLSVHRSLKNISAQIIDDTTGTTLASASSIEKAVEGSGNIAGARKVGTLLGERAKEKGINSVVFDRGGFRYHGRVASLADGAREAGLEF